MKWYAVTIVVFALIIVAITSCAGSRDLHRVTLMGNTTFERDDLWVCGDLDVPGELKCVEFGEFVRQYRSMQPQSGTEL